MPDQKKVAIVTGGSRGIGASCMEVFAREGIRVANLDKSPPEGGEGAGQMQLVCDVSREESVESAVTEVIRRWGRVDYLVNNAGVQRYGTVTETSTALWDEVMNVNLKSMFLCARAVLPYMQRQGAGVIVNVASVQAFHSQANVAAYTTAKTAALGLTRSIAVDYAPAVRCVAVCPGTIDTPMLRESVARAPDPDEVLNEIYGMHLARRMGRPEEVAELILFVCGDKAVFMTGQAIRIDGGLGIVIQGSKR